MSFPFDVAPAPFRWQPRWDEAGEQRQVGYSCHTLMALTINREYFGARHYVWFSTELNPLLNGESARPLCIYEDLDVAVKHGDVRHPKIHTLRNGILRGIDKRRGDLLIQPGWDDSKVDALKGSVARASIQWFRPQLVKVKVKDMHRSDGVDADECREKAKNNGAIFQDEYLADAVAESALVVIVE